MKHGLETWSDSFRRQKTNRKCKNSVFNFKSKAIIIKCASRFQNAEKVTDKIVDVESNKVACRNSSSMQNPVLEYETVVLEFL